MPDASHLLLLHAALGSKTESIQAWKTWSSQFDLDYIDPATFRLLPTVYNALVQHGEGGLACKRVKGVYRFWWVRQQQLFSAISETIALLQNAGIPVLFIKGVPLAHTAYAQPAARTMQDADICVPSSDLERALGLLAQIGWNPKEPLYVACSLRHEITLCRSPHSELDLQRYALESCRWNGFNDHIFNRATTFAFRDHEALMPCPEDHLAILCSHGMRHSDEISFHWIADVVLLLRHCDKNDLSFDWEKLAAIVDKARLRAPIHDALLFIEWEFRVGVPDWLLQRLKPSDESMVFRREYEARLRPYNSGNAFWLHAGLYARLRLAGERISPRTYLRSYWNVAGPVDLLRIWHRHRRLQRSKRSGAA